MASAYEEDWTDMKIVENYPLNTAILEEMISDPEDLSLVWPVAHWPFDHGQWQQVLDPKKARSPFPSWNTAMLPRSK